jgi:transposase
VNQINLDSLGFHRVQAKQTGRPYFNPATLLKLYIYGYLNRIQPSRCLKKETHCNVELMWLVERLSPDFKPLLTSQRTTVKVLGTPIVSV